MIVCIQKKFRHGPNCVAPNYNLHHSPGKRLFLFCLIEHLTHQESYVDQNLGKEIRTRNIIEPVSSWHPILLAVAGI